MGESATCQSRITWTEMHVTAGESAPCPAAHVVVMSECVSCGECLFEDVKCLHGAGLDSPPSGDDSFMYRKYEEEDAPQQQPRLIISSSNALTSAGLAGSAAALLLLAALRVRGSSAAAVRSSLARDGDSEFGRMLVAPVLEDNQ